jgi:phosphonate transport system substrate-binding protein
MPARDAKLERRRMLGMALATGVLLLVEGGCGETPHADAEQPDPLNSLHADGASPTTLRIGITPSSGQDTGKRLTALLEYLESKLNMTVTATTAKSYDDLAVLVNDGEIEVGIFSPLAYVKARDDKSGSTLRAVPLATVTRRGSPTYLGYIVVRSDDEARSVHDLKGRRVAWVDPSSTSGYLYPRMLLRDKGIADVDAFLGEAVFAEGHDSAIVMLDSGEVDVTAVASAFVDRGSQNALNDVYNDEKTAAEQLRVIAKTQRIPFDCVVVRSDVSRKLAAELRAALLSMNKDVATVQALEDNWGMSGFVRPEGRYESVAAALKHAKE